MLIFQKISTLRLYLNEQRRKGLSIGFVPTMGALHQGHLSLLETAQKESDCTVCSIFVNPNQFNNPDDLLKYPRMIEKDVNLLKNNCDVLFYPSEKEMYPQQVVLTFDFKHLDQIMEGASRQGHFSGVATVVSKLLHFVEPDIAFFGQKDLQQCFIIQQLVKDLSFFTTIRVCPTIRETDGLAMSSRNVRLNDIDRKNATNLYQNLKIAQNLIQKQENNPLEVKKIILQNFQELEKINIRLDYFEIVDMEDFKILSDLPIHGTFIAICIAAYVRDIR
jgi:pantoate--beta-alanine ligase